MIAMAENIASFVIPSRIKKLWLLSSLAPVALNKEPNSHLAKELNALFNMASDSNSMLLPMEYGSRYWTGLESNNNQNDLKEKAAKQVPKWLRYANQETIKNDITLLLAMNH